MDLAWERKIISEKVETIPRDRCAEITFRIVARSGNGLFPKKKKGKKREKESERYKIATLKLFSSLFVRSFVKNTNRPFRAVSILVALH